MINGIFVIQPVYYDIPEEITYQECNDGGSSLTYFRKIEFECELINLLHFRKQFIFEPFLNKQLLKKYKCMKVISKILLSVFCITMFMACGDDDDPIAIPQGPKIRVYTYTAELEGSTRYGKVFLDLEPLVLENVIGSEPARNLTKASLQYDNTYLMIKGLKDLDPSPDLQNLELKVNGNSFPLGTASADPSEIQSDERCSNEKIRPILEFIFSQLTSGNKKVELELGYKTTENFIVEDGVTFNLVFNMQYYWNTYSK